MATNAIIMTMRLVFLCLVLMACIKCNGVTAFAGLRPPAFSATTTTNHHVVMSRQLQQPLQQQHNVPPLGPKILVVPCNNRRSSSSSALFNAHNNRDNMTPRLEPIPSEEEGIPIPFVDVGGASFIECYADSVAVLNGIQYTIGVPCDHSVALCYYDDLDQLVPVELEDDLMDDIFPICEQIVAEEFGEELTLQRTPQTLTLVGELDEDEDDDVDDDNDDDDEDGMEDGEEEVEVLLSFEHRGTEFNLVRLLDPILLVGKIDETQPDRRVLLTPEESDNVMPILEQMFLEFHKEDSMLP